MSRIDPQAYKESRTREYTLPTGGTVLCRKPNLMRMLSNFDLQPALMAVQKAQEALGAATSEQEAQEREREMLAAFSKDGIAFGCAVICDSVTEPAISLQGKNGEFCVFDLDMADMSFLLDELLGWLGVPREKLAVLAPFRDARGTLRAFGAVEGAAQQLTDQDPGTSV